MFFDQVCPKMEFLAETGKIALVRASMVVTYYIILFRTGPTDTNGILMSLVLLVAETIMFNSVFFRMYLSTAISTSANIYLLKVNNDPTIKM